MSITWVIRFFIQKQISWKQLTSSLIDIQENRYSLHVNHANTWAVDVLLICIIISVSAFFASPCALSVFSHVPRKWNYEEPTAMSPHKVTASSQRAIPRTAYYRVVCGVVYEENVLFIQRSLSAVSLIRDRLTFSSFASPNVYYSKRWLRSDKAKNRIRDRRPPNSSKYFLFCTSHHFIFVGILSVGAKLDCRWNIREGKKHVHVHSTRLEIEWEKKERSSWRPQSICRPRSSGNSDK